MEKRKLLRAFDSLLKEPFDLVVVGGGIYGACITESAARIGFKVCLFEEQDFGARTSANSLHVVHGGLRYLQHLDFRRMRESTRARRLWLERFPGLIRPLEFRLPTFGYGLAGPEVMRAALALNDLISADRNRGLAADQRLSRGRIIRTLDDRTFPSGIVIEGANGVAVWYDGLILNSERVLVAILAGAAVRGARLCNYARVERVLTEHNRVTGVTVTDLISNRSGQVSAAAVIDATGPWCGSCADDLKTLVEPSRAFNLLTRRLPFDYAIGLPVRETSPKGGASRKGAGTYFVVPFGEYSLIGTKHLPGRGNGPELVSAEEVGQFVTEINSLLACRPLNRLDVLRVLEGILPAAEMNTTKLLQAPIVIDHGARGGAEGLMSLAGIKWTTANTTASRVVRLLARRYRPRGRTSEASPVDERQARPKAARSRSAGVCEPRLVRLYGEVGASVIQGMMRREPSLAKVVVGTNISRAEILWTVREEMAMKLADVVFRRTEIGSNCDISDRTLDECARIVGDELHWSSEARRREVGAVERSMSDQRERLDRAFLGVTAVTEGEQPMPLKG